jgi:hypothetical protein
LKSLPIFFAEKAIYRKRGAIGQEKRKTNIFNGLGSKSWVGSARCLPRKRAMSMQLTQFMLPYVNKTKDTSVLMGKASKNQFE